MFSPGIGALGVLGVFLRLWLVDCRTKVKILCRDVDCLLYFGQLCFNTNLPHHHVNMVKMWFACKFNNISLLPLLCDQNIVSVAPPGNTICFLFFLSYLFGEHRICDTLQEVELSTAMKRKWEERRRHEINKTWIRGCVHFNNRLQTPEVERKWFSVIYCTVAITKTNMPR